MVSILEHEGPDVAEGRLRKRSGEEAPSTTATERLLGSIEATLLSKEAELEAARAEVSDRNRRLSALASLQSQAEEERGRFQEESLRRKQAEKELKKLQEKLDQTEDERRRLEGLNEALNQELAKTSDAREALSRMEHIARAYKRRCSLEAARRKEVEARCAKLEQQLLSGISQRRT